MADPSNAGIHERRRLRLKELIDLKTTGNRRAFAKQADVNPTYITQILNEHRQLGEQVARRIEENWSVPVGWLDRQEEDDGSAEVPEQRVRINRMLDEMTIEQLEQIELVCHLMRLSGRDSQPRGIQDLVRLSELLDQRTKG